MNLIRPLHSSSKQIVGCRIKTLHPSARRILFFHHRIIVTEEGTEESTVIVYLRVHGTREGIRVKAVAVGLVVLLGPWIVYQQSIQSRQTANNNAN